MVDVEGQDVLVNVLDHDQVLLALELQLEHGVDAVVTDQCGHLQAVNGEVQDVDGVAVDDARDLACSAQTASEALAELGTDFSLQYGALRSHK